MKDPAVSTVSNGLGDRTEMPWWNLPLLLTLAWHTRAPHHQTFVLPCPEYKAVLHWHGWTFSFRLDTEAEPQQAFLRYTGFSRYHPLQSPFHPAKALSCSVAMKWWRSFQREMCFWIWDLVCYFWPGKLPLEQWAWDFSWNLLCVPFWRNSWKEKTCKLSSQRGTYWLWVHWGHYLRSVDLWEGTAYLMQPKVSYATDGLFFVVKNGFSMCLWKSKVLLKACCVLAGSCWVSSSSDLL